MPARPNDDALLGHWRGLVLAWLLPGGALGLGAGIWLLASNGLAPPWSDNAGRILLASLGAVVTIATLVGAAAVLAAEGMRRLPVLRTPAFGAHLALAAGFWPAWICLELSRLASSPAAAGALRVGMIAVLLGAPLLVWVAVRRRTPRGPGPALLAPASVVALAVLAAFARLLGAIPALAPPAGPSAATAAAPIQTGLAPVFEPLPGGLVAEGLQANRNARLIVIGVDGLPPSLLERTIDAGLAPNLAALRGEGAWGALETLHPTASPPIWNSVATGRPPSEHGITGFTTSEYPGLRLSGIADPSALEFARPVLDRVEPMQRVPVSSRSRRIKALWNLCSEAGIRVGVVGWMASWPAEAVDGFVVSDHAFFQQRHMGPLRDVRRREERSSYTHPPELLELLREYQASPEEATPDLLEPFVDLQPADRANFPALMDASREGPATLRWLAFFVQKDRFYARSALRLQAEYDPRVLLVYLQSVDQFAHLIWRFTPPEAADAGHDPQDLARHRRSMERVLASVDTWIGRLIAGRDENTTVFVLSDHGWGRMDEPDDRDGRPRYGHGHAPPGVFVAAGRGIAPVGRIEGARILDVTPTLLRLVGLPLSEELHGRVLDEILEPELLRAPARTVASYEVGPPTLRTPQTSGEDDAMIENLRALGYIE